MKSNKALFIIHASVLVAAVVGAWLAVRFNWSLWPCMTYTIFGLYCPGCGITRAFKQLVQLDVVSSVKLNAVPLMLSFFMAATLLFELINYNNYKKIPQKYVILSTVFIISVAVVQSIIKNLLKFKII